MKPFVIPGGILEIQLATAKHFRITREDMCSNKLHTRLVLPRQIAAYLAIKRTGRSRHDIARLFGEVDHTTIGYRAEAIMKDLNTYAGVLASIEAALDKSIQDATQ